MTADFKDCSSKWCLKLFSNILTIFPATLTKQLSLQANLISLSISIQFKLRRELWTNSTFINSYFVIWGGRFADLKPSTEKNSISLILEFYYPLKPSNQQLSQILKAGNLYTLWEFFFALAFNLQALIDCRFQRLPAKMMFNIAFWNSCNFFSANLISQFFLQANLISFSISIHFKSNREGNYELSQHWLIHTFRLI